jgi:hypothetical protein
MSVLTAQQFELLLPLACAWATEQEQVILRSGVALTEPEMTDARRVGVAQPEQVRLLRVPEVPLPSHPVLAAAAEATGFISPLTQGLTLRHGIFIRGDCWGDRRLVVHELAHTMQYERLGSIEAFLRRYLDECLTIGYPEAPLEQEARSIEQSVVAMTRKRCSRA